MNRVEDILKRIDWTGECDGNHPIFQILMVEHPDKEIMSVQKDGTSTGSGFPDLGCTHNAGFFYSLQEAVYAVVTNECDIRETCYNAAFILCKFQGLYSSCTASTRMYFVWDNDVDQFVQKDEPNFFRHIVF